MTISESKWARRRSPPGAEVGDLLVVLVADSCKYYARVLISQLPDTVLGSPILATFGSSFGMTTPGDGFLFPAGAEAHHFLDPNTNLKVRSTCCGTSVTGQSESSLFLAPADPQRASTLAADRMLIPLHAALAWVSLRLRKSRMAPAISWAWVSSAKWPAS